MNRRDLFRTALGIPFAGATFAASSPAAAPATGSLLNVGFAEEDITPAVGMEQPGGYGKSYHETIHDPCKIRVAVFDDGSHVAALVGLDALLVPRHTVEGARAAIASRCGTPAHAVMIGASHSHSSGPIGMISKGDYDHAPEFVQRLAYEHSTLDNAEYSLMVEEKIVAGVCRAFEQRDPMACSIGTGIEDKAAFNRRFRMPNGLCYSHPGQGNPDIIEPAGPTDPIVTVLGAWDDARNLKRCVVNYSCHATTSPGGISANWIYYLEKAIRGVMGPTLPSSFCKASAET